MLDYEKIGLFLSNERKKEKLTQKQLAEKINITFQAVSRWEKGISVPSLDVLDDLSRIFNVSIDEILDNESKEFLMNKISNTERLAGIIIKILKVIGFILMLAQLECQYWNSYQSIIMILLGNIVPVLYLYILYNNYHLDCNIDSNFLKYSGKGAENSMYSPVFGCIKPIVCACNVCPCKFLKADRLLEYRASPSKGCPILAICTRI